MPARARKARPPKAARKKVWVHIFYLAQPFLQFFALIAIMLILARCSPLAPSTDKVSALKVEPSSDSNSIQAELAAQEEAIQKGLKELSTAELKVISESQYEHLLETVPSSDQPMEESGIRSFFEQRKKISNLRRKPDVLLLPLEPARQEAFFAHGQIRIELHSRLQSASKDKAVRLLLRHLKQSVESKELGGSLLLVLPDATLTRVQGAFTELKIPVKISLSQPQEHKAYLELVRLEDDPALVQNNAVLLDAALKEALQVAILLE